MKRKRGWGQEKRCQNLSKSVLIQNKAGKLIILLVTAAVSRQDPSTNPHHKHTHTHTCTHTPTSDTFCKSNKKYHIVGILGD